MTVAVENAQILFDASGRMKLHFDVCPESVKAIKVGFENLQGKKLKADIKRWTKARSLDANAFLWVLCDQIAQVVGTTKEEIYRAFVHDVGVFEYIPIKESEVERHAEMWAKIGVGWLSEDMGPSKKMEGYHTIRRYYGSSTYDQAQMSRLLDEAIMEAEALGIPTLPDNDIKKMKEQWHA